MFQLVGGGRLNGCLDVPGGSRFDVAEGKTVMGDVAMSVLVGLVVLFGAVVYERGRPLSVATAVEFDLSERLNS